MKTKIVITVVGESSFCNQKVSSGGIFNLNKKIGVLSIVLLAQNNRLLSEAHDGTDSEVDKKIKVRMPVTAFMQPCVNVLFYIF